MEAYHWYRFIAAGTKYSKNNPSFNLQKRKKIELEPQDLALNLDLKEQSFLLPASHEKWVLAHQDHLYLSFPHIIYEFHQEINIAPFLWTPCQVKPTTEGLQITVLWEKSTLNLALLLFIETHYGLHGDLIHRILDAPLSEKLYHVLKHTDPQISSHLFKGLLKSIPNQEKSKPYYRLNLERRPFLFELNAYLTTYQALPQFNNLPSWKTIQSTPLPSKPYHHLLMEEPIADQIHYAISKGKNIAVEGAAGTGKTSLIIKLSQYYSSLNYDCEIVVPTKTLKSKIQEELLKPVRLYHPKHQSYFNDFYKEVDGDRALIDILSDQKQIDPLPQEHQAYSSTFLQHLSLLIQQKEWYTPLQSDDTLKTFFQLSRCLQIWKYRKIRKQYQIPFKRKKLLKRVQEDGMDLTIHQILNQSWQKSFVETFYKIPTPPIALNGAFKRWYIENKKAECSNEQQFYKEAYHYLKHKYANTKSVNTELLPITHPIRVYTAEEYLYKNSPQADLVFIDEANAIPTFQMVKAFRSQVISFADPQQYLHQSHLNLLQQIKKESLPNFQLWTQQNEWPQYQLTQNYRWPQKKAQIHYEYVIPNGKAIFQHIEQHLTQHPNSWLVCLIKEDTQVLKQRYPNNPTYHLSEIIGLQCDHLIFVSSQAIMSESDKQNFGLLSKKNKATLFHILSTRAKQKVYLLHSIHPDLLEESTHFLPLQIAKKQQMDLSNFHAKSAPQSASVMKETIKTLNFILKNRRKKC